MLVFLSWMSLRASVFLRASVRKDVWLFFGSGFKHTLPGNARPEHAAMRLIPFVFFVFFAACGEKAKTPASEPQVKPTPVVAPPPPQWTQAEFSRRADPWAPRSASMMPLSTPRP
jgi:hypothetical protein